MNLVLQLCGWVLLGGEASAASEVPALWRDKKTSELQLAVGSIAAPPSWTLPPEALMPAKIRFSGKKSKGRTAKSASSKVDAPPQRSEREK
jgi:hypothetical protein